MAAGGKQDPLKILWRRSPFLLFRFPGLLLAIIVVSAIAAITAVTGPAFLASTETGSLREGVEQAGRWTSGYRVGFDGFFATRQREDKAAISFFGLRDRAESALAERTEGIEQLDGPYVATIGSELTAVTDKAQNRVRLLSRTDAFNNVTVVDGGGSDGVWLADVTARQLGVEVGDEIELESPVATTSARVAATYKYLTRQPPSDYWSPFTPLIYRAAGEEVDPPVFVLAEGKTLERVTKELHDYGFIQLDFPLSHEEVTLEEARTVVRELNEITAELEIPSSVITQEIGYAEFRFNDIETTSSLYSIVAKANERIETVSPVADLLSTAARLVAFAVMAAAGFYLVKRRRTECATLVARGIGPMQQGLRYGIESLIPSVLGTALGVIGGYILVSKLGPATELPWSVIGRAKVSLITTFILSLLILILAASFAVSREEHDIAEKPATTAHVRWLQVGAILSIAGGFFAYRMSNEVSAESLTDLRDPMLTLVPVILTLAGGVLTASLFRAVLPRFAGRVRFRWPSLYLSARRLSGASAMTQVLVIAGAWALGVAVYGLTMSASVSAAASSKAHLYLGSDYSTLVPGEANLSQVSVPATQVTRVQRTPLGDAGDTAILVLDPQTFHEAAFWRSDFADRSLESLIDLIDEPGTPAPVLATFDPGTNPMLTSGTREVPVEVKATVHAFPGMPPDGRMLIMARDTFTGLIGDIAGSSSPRVEEIWARGDRDTIETELRRANISIFRGLDAESVLDSPSLQSLLWLLGFLAALGAAAALIAILGLLLYLQARQRTALVSSALTRRMGLGRRSEFVSWTGEVAGALLVSLLGAIVAGLPVAALMKNRLDPRPALQPAPSLITPVALLIGMFVALVLVAMVSGWRVQKSIDHTDVAEVMRT